MPRKGYRTITVPDETYSLIDEIWRKHEKEFRRQGIFSKQQLLHKMILEYVESLEGGEGSGSGSNI